MPLGHGVGVEVNELPLISSVNKQRLQENMIITLEIHLLRKGTGLVKLEDTVLIGPQKNEILTLSPRELLESDYF